MPGIKRNYKDTVFCDLFSDKENALSLYNALNSTDYTNVDDLEIVTLSEIIYMHQKNDVSIMFQNEIALWEHQSSLNYNMPLRGLIYFAHNIDGILQSHGMNLYGKKLIRIPAPDYYVLYNGTDQVPEVQELKLSDSFLAPKEGYEWTAHMLNINAGHNLEVLEKCPALKGYAMLVEYVREYQKEGLNLPDAVDNAVSRCIREGYLKTYLLKKRSEVNLMLLTEFNEEAFVQTIREEGREQGQEEGREQGRYQSLRSLMKKAKMSLGEAMDILDFSKDERAGYEAWAKAKGGG